LREAWTKKTDNPIEIFENYPFTRGNSSAEMPALARDLGCSEVDFQVGHVRLGDLVVEPFACFVLLITGQGKAVGEPYRGKPDVRFDEGDLRTTTRFG
jgi:hypothetical protein